MVPRPIPRSCCPWWCVRLALPAPTKWSRQHHAPDASLAFGLVPIISPPARKVTFAAVLGGVSRGTHRCRLVVGKRRRPSCAGDFTRGAGRNADRASGSRPQADPPRLEFGAIGEILSRGTGERRSLGGAFAVAFHQPASLAVPVLALDSVVGRE